MQLEMNSEHLQNPVSEQKMKSSECQIHLSVHIGIACGHATNTKMRKTISGETQLRNLKGDAQDSQTHRQDCLSEQSTPSRSDETVSVAWVEV